MPRRRPVYAPPPTRPCPRRRRESVGMSGRAATAQRASIAPDTPRAPHAADRHRARTDRRGQRAHPPFRAARVHSRARIPATGPTNENAFCCIATTRSPLLVTDRRSQWQQQRGLGCARVRQLRTLRSHPVQTWGDITWQSKVLGRSQSPIASVGANERTSLRTLLD